MKAVDSTASSLNDMELMGSGDAYKETLCEIIEALPLLANFSSTEVKLLANYMLAYRVCQGTTIFEEGSRDRFMAFVSSGHLQVYKEGEPGEQHELATVRPGMSIGEMSLLDNQPHSATVIASEETELLVLSGEKFQKLEEKFPHLAFKMLWIISLMLSNRLRKTSGILVDYLG
ncbi:MAG: cyclic nucleotide-binding domain-containing protein [Candidatus Sedimenticola sp. (ex Thyasira tokunagai)]